MQMAMGPVELTPDAAAAKAAEELARGARRIAIVGRPGSGRSLALDRLSGSLATSTPVRVALSRADDAAFVGLVELARQVSSDDPAVLDLVRDPKERWSTKLTETLRVLGQKERVILFEDPLLGRLGDGSPSVFALRTQELTTAIGDIASANIVYAATLTDPISKKIHVRAGSNPHEVLAESQWSLEPLRTAAGKLLRLNSRALSRYSPLEVRLAVACVANGVGSDEIVARRWSADELLAGALSGVNSAGVRRIVGVLSYCRVPFELKHASQILEADVSTEEERLLEEALLIHVPHGFLVHEIVARHARTEGWANEEPRAVHDRFARWHRANFEEKAQSVDLGRATRHEIEVVHHLTEAGNAKAVLDASVFFSEQYDVLGKVLSVAKRYDDAVRAYERALEYDDEDAYAHHYLAFNLDVPGLDAPRVYCEYARARQLQSEHVWYHSRLVTFLITVGRVLDAEDAWAEALGDLTIDESGAVYQELHRNVAALLLHRGELKFAAKVLKSVPRAAQATCDWYRPLEQRLQLLEEAATDRSVFPPAVRISERWDGPHLLRSNADRAKVAAWMPGRITSVDDESLRIRFCRRENGSERFFYREFDHARLTELSAHARHGLSLPEGTFVEFLTYTDGTEQILTWQRQASELAALAIHPAPDRYIRRAVTGSR